MDAPENFHVEPEFARYRPSGNTSFREAMMLVAQAVAYARERGWPRLLVDSTALAGFESPTTLERYDLATTVAAAAQSQVKVVIVARPEMIDPARFGVTVARNRGLHAAVYSSEAEALTWLLDAKTN